LYEEKLLSEVFKNGRRGLLGSQKTAHLIRLQREREESKKDLVSDSLFLYFLARGCLYPRAHNIDDVHKTLSVVVAYTLHVHRVSADPFFLVLSFHHFLPRLLVQ
jgi:hypothetical protein